MTTGLSGKGTKRTRRRLPIVLILSSLLLSAAIGLFSIELVRFSQDADRLPPNLTVGGIVSGGLTQGQAVALWERTYAEPIVLFYNDSPILLQPSSIGFRINRETMLAESLAAKETEGGFWLRFYNHLTRQELDQPITIPLYADYQRNLLEQLLNDISARYDRASGTPSYDVPTLTTYAGNPGFVLDVPQAVTLIDAALRSPNNRIVSLPVTDATTNRPSLETLRRLITDYLDSQNFIYDGQRTIASVFIMDLISGEEISILGDVAFSGASTTKAAILVDYYRYLNTPPSQEEAWLMANSLLCSRNSSSNLLMQISGGGVNVFNGITNVTRTAQFLGARNTFIAAPFVEGVASQQLGSVAVPPTNPNPNYNTGPDPYNQTTAEDLGTLFGLMYDCANYGSGLMTAYPNGEFTQNECRQMLELMSANDLQRLLQGGLPPGTRISHKNGWLTDMVGDAGVVYPPNGRDYVISVFLWEEAEFQDYLRLWPLVEGISRAAWNFFSPQSALLSPRTDLPPTAEDCEGNYLPPNAASVNLDDINAWRRSQ